VSVFHIITLLQYKLFLLLLAN